MKKNQNVWPALILATALSITNIGCNKKAKNDADKFNRAAMLENLSENIIIPAYANMLVQTKIFNNAINTLVQNPSKINLQQAQTIFQYTLIAWQQANAFNFGPAGEEGIKKTLNEEIGVFPVSIAKIEAYIKNGDTIFANFDRDSRGLYAIEYLLFSKPEDSLIVDLENSNRKNYLLACINHIEKNVQKVVNAWQNGYKTEFIKNAGTDIGSSTSQFYNEYLKSFEALKNFKFAVPLGLRPGQTEPLPKHVEAYYSGISIKLAKNHWQTLKNIWYGKSLSIPVQDGIGFNEYLLSVTGGEALINSTQAQMAAVDFALSQLDENKKLSDLIQSEIDKVKLVHTELQKQTRFLKSDLSSLIGIAITYSSGDGD